MPKTRLFLLAFCVCAVTASQISTLASEEPLDGEWKSIRDSYTSTLKITGNRFIGDVTRSQPSHIRLECSGTIDNKRRIDGICLGNSLVNRSLEGIFPDNVTAWSRGGSGYNNTMAGVNDNPIFSYRNEAVEAQKIAAQKLEESRRSEAETRSKQQDAAALEAAQLAEIRAAREEVARQKHEIEIERQKLVREMREANRQRVDQEKRTAEAQRTDVNAGSTSKAQSKTTKSTTQSDSNIAGSEKKNAVNMDSEEEKTKTDKPILDSQQTNKPKENALTPPAGTVNINYGKTITIENVELHVAKPEISSSFGNGFTNYDAGLNERLVGAVVVIKNTSTRAVAVREIIKAVMFHSGGQNYAFNEAATRAYSAQNDINPAIPEFVNSGQVVSVAFCFSVGIESTQQKDTAILIDTAIGKLLVR
jgi:hypothetical protein